MDYLLAIIFWAALGGAVGGALGKSRGKANVGVLLGALFGPLGWLLVAAGSSDAPKCPDCLGEVVPGAKKCKNCGSSLDAAQAAADHKEARAGDISVTQIVGWLAVAAGGVMLFASFTMLQTGNTDPNVGFIQTAVMLVGGAVGVLGMYLVYRK